MITASPLLESGLPRNYFHGKPHVFRPNDNDYSMLPCLVPQKTTFSLLSKSTSRRWTKLTSRAWDMVAVLMLIDMMIR